MLQSPEESIQWDENKDLQTVLPKVAQNDDDVEDVIAGVFNKHFSPAKVTECRK